MIEDTNPPLLKYNFDNVREARSHSAPVRLARRIALEIIERDVQVGTHLGALPEVAKRYGVSVPTLRKAVTHLLDDGIVTAREGRSGGLVVAAPPAQAAIRAMYLFLSKLNPTRAHIDETRNVISDALAERACRLVNDADQRLIETILNDARNIVPAERRAAIAAFDVALLAASKQPVLALVSTVLDRLERNHEQHAQLDLDEELRLRRETTRAIVGGNLADAMALHRRLRSVGEPAPEESPPVRLPDRISASIGAMILERQLSSGDEIGHEPALQSLFGVGRTTLRDALRPLERNGTIKVMQGRGGGIFVGSAEPYAAVEMASLYLSSIKLTLQEQIDSRQILEARAAWFAAERISPPLRDRLAKAMRADAKAARDALPDWPVRGTSVERLIAQACGNPLFEFFTLALIDVSILQAQRQGISDVASYSELASFVSQHHGDIVDAILAGLPAKAAFKTRRYINQLGEWMSRQRSVP